MMRADAELDTIVRDLRTKVWPRELHHIDLVSGFDDHGRKFMLRAAGPGDLRWEHAVSNSAERPDPGDIETGLHCLADKIEASLKN